MKTSALAACIAAALTCATLTPAGPARSQAAAQAAALTPEERRLIVAAAARAGTDLSPLDDAAAVRETIAYARRELGVRIRPIAVDRLWGLAPPTRNPEAEFAAARAAGALGDWLEGLSPRQPRYTALKAAAERYRAASLDPFVPLASMPTLREGMAHPALAEVRARLAKEGFPTPAPAPAEPDRFDAGLTAAVIAFQGREGLSAEGVLGPATQAALNTSPAARLVRIEANLERLRWLPRELPADRLEVNIAAAEATLYRQDLPALTMRIVVGDLGHKTPMFASRIESVVLNPPWNVPTSIAQNEILPRAARDPGYLGRNGYTLRNGSLQQRPGANNALGRIKFDLPSPYGVYLHDTPGKSAFARPVRTLSHGCMRLEKPRELALAILGAQGWSDASIGAAIDAGATQRVNLDRPVPLFVTYQTVMVEETGALRFAPDVYGWDAKLTAALRGMETVIASARPGTDCADA